MSFILFLHTAVLLAGPGAADHVALPSTTPHSKRYQEILAITAQLEADAKFASEQFAANAARRLEELAVALALRSEPQRLEPFIAPGAAGPPLKPGRLETVFEDAYFVVRRGAEEPPAAVQTAPLGEHLAAFTTPLEPVHTEFHVETVEDLGDTARTRVRVTCWGNVPAGLRQHNAIWDITWNRSDLRLNAIVPWFYEEVCAAAALFEDRTAAVVGPAPGVAEQLQLDTPYWSSRLDRLWAHDTFGHYGLCVGDVNVDGRDDLLVNRGPGLPNLLLVQERDGSVANAAAEAHVDFLEGTRAGLLVDMDNDGDPDLVMSAANATLMFENDGEGVFEPAPRFQARTGNPADFYSMAAVDYDLNGRLDVYSTRFMPKEGIGIPLPLADAQNGAPDHLLAQQDAWRFDDVTSACGLSQNNHRFGMAAAWDDVDRDGHSDLYVANRFGPANLYVNQAGRFSDLAAERGLALAGGGTGVSWADYDNDGIMDLFASGAFSPAGLRLLERSDYRPDDGPHERSRLRAQAAGCALLRGLPGGGFEDASEALPRSIAGWGWGGLFADINNDGRADLLVPNGYLSGTGGDVDRLFWSRVAAASPSDATPRPEYFNGWAAIALLVSEGHSWSGGQRHATFLNIGGGRFADVSAISGFGHREDGRALALSDWDRDGDLDLWLANRTAPTLRFFQNTASERRAGGAHFLSLQLLGRSGNPQAIGARVTVTAGGREMTGTLRAGSGYLAQSSAWMHFGLGASEVAERITVRWPGGALEHFGGAQCDRRYRLREGRGEALPLPSPEAATVLSQPAAPPLATQAGATSATHDGVKSSSTPLSTVLLERLSLPDIPLPRRGAEPVGTDSKLGHPYVLVFWSPDSPPSIETVRALAAGSSIAELMKLEIVPVRVPSGAAANGARDGAEHDNGLAGPISLEADARLLDVVDILQQEVLGPGHDLQLPTAFVIDYLGRLASIHRGPVGLEAVLADLNRSERAQFPYPGRVLASRSRDYAGLARMLRGRGHTDLAAYYERLHTRRTPATP